MRPRETDGVSPFVSQEVPDPEELNEVGFHASYIEVEGASEAVLVAEQSGHWADASVEAIQFEVYVRSASTDVVTRFLAEGVNVPAARPRRHRATAPATPRAR